MEDSSLDFFKREHLFQKVDCKNVKNLEPDESYVYLPCQTKVRLRAEDEISISSIFSNILAKIEPSETYFTKCDWDIDAKAMLNAKQCILFEEKWHVSRLKDTNCKLSEETKIFLERELEEIGEFQLNIEESYDGYVVFSNSKIKKGAGDAKCGHSLKGKYDDKFMLICEKRTEFDHVDNARIEKSLEVRNKMDKMIAIRETKINGESQKFKAIINTKGREEAFILDGGVMLLMRFLIANNFVGEFEYYSLNLYGKVIRCSLQILSERKQVRVFYKMFQTKCVISTQYFNDTKQEVSETFLTPDGKIVLHYWHGYNYLLHSVKAPCAVPEKILPKLELKWKADNILFERYQLAKKLNYENGIEYLVEHPEASDFLHDYILSLLKYKPAKVLDFSIKFFQNMKSNY